MSNLIFCLMGPTASGKTDLACELLEQLPVEIISVDSAMIYRDMNIGTAKPDKQTLKRAPHHLIDMLDPPDNYSAAHFCEDAVRISEQIIRQGKIPLLVGGTMMYFRALQQGLSSLPEADEHVRAELLLQAEQHGWASLHDELRRVDAMSAQRIHPNDTQRVQRALEVYRITQRPLSELLSSKGTSDFDFVNLALLPSDRAWLHQRIAQRFEQMLSEGFVNEVEELLKKWHLTEAHPAMRTVGYRQIIAYLNGECDYADMIAKGIAATRQLAKRQLTWLRHWPESVVFSAENPTNGVEILKVIKQVLNEA
jgi:tRNA dimethylallyltransferase